MTRSQHTPQRTHQHVDSRADASALGQTECATLQAAVLRANPRAHAGLVAEALDWARAVRLHALLLDMVLAGEVDIVLSADGDELSFRQHSAASIIPFGLPGRRSAGGQ